VEVVGPWHDRALGDGGMAEEQRLELRGRDLQRVDLDEVLEAVDDEDVPSASMWPRSPVRTQPSASRCQPTNWRHLVGERGWDAADYARRTADSIVRELIANV
jgi:hypothetical protein